VIMKEHTHIVTMVHKNGIVNVVKHYADGVQIIWRGNLNLVSKTALDHDCVEKVDIKNFRAIYVDGVLVVKNGKVWPRRSILSWFLGLGD